MAARPHPLPIELARLVCLEFLTGRRRPRAACMHIEGRRMWVVPSGRPRPAARG